MRRGIAGSLGVSLGVHAAAFAAITLTSQTQPRDAAAGAGLGADLVFVELLSRSGGAPQREDRAEPLADGRGSQPRERSAARARRLDSHAAPRSAARREAASPLAPVPIAEREPTRGPGARADTEPTAGGMQRAAHDAEAPSGSARSTPHDGQAQLAGSHSSRVARPASEIRPRYPDVARERGDEAEVVVEAWVAASGRVEDARIRRSAGSAFDRAALDAVRRARFHPASRDGEPVPSRVAMRLHFALEH
ncbi:MAG TPA: TonB family protein [Myxococcota bacterium]|nr:TonB family protein [Myxococcota bacterium]